MFDFFDIFKVDPTISDPAAASGITRDSKGTIHQKHTAASNQLAHNLAAISATAWGPVADGVLVPSVEYTPIASKMLPKAANSVINMGGKTQPLLGMSKSLPSVKGTTALATKAANSGSKWTKGIAGTVALGTAVGQGVSEPSQKKGHSYYSQLVNLKFKQGGQMYKYAAGAQMVQPQQTGGQQGIEQQAMALVQAAMQGDQKANQTIQKIMQAAQQGDQQAAQVAQLLKNIVQQMKGSRKARLGAKLDYIKQSIGECPEGQEVVYFKKGGEICKVCAGKKMQDGGKSDPIKNFKKKKEQDAVKQAYQRNPYTRGKSAKEIAEMQRRNRQEAGTGKGENDAKVAPWNYKKKR